MARNRVLALAVVGACLGLLRWLAPEFAQRAAWLHLVALPLGYGHVVGAAVFARSRRRRPRRPKPERLLLAAFAGSGVLTLFAAYASALGSPVLQPLVLTPILLLFAWHVVENDFALGRAYRSQLRLGPVARAPRPHAVAILLAAGVGLAAFSTPEGALFSRAYFGAALAPVQPWLGMGELSAAVVLYHTLSWLLFFEDRVRVLRQSSPPEAALLRRRVHAFHVIPLAVNGILYLWLPAVHFYLAAPAFYFFWSALHALHTARARGLEPRAAPA